MGRKGAAGSDSFKLHPWTADALYEHYGFQHGALTQFQKDANERGRGRKADSPWYQVDALSYDPLRRLFEDPRGTAYENARWTTLAIRDLVGKPTLPDPVTLADWKRMNSSPGPGDFVPLNLRVERAGRPRESFRRDSYEDLGALLEDAGLGQPAIAILGGPGAGKSTLLLHFAYSQGRRWSPGPRRLYAPLRDYRPNAPDHDLSFTLAWLQETWARSCEGDILSRLRKGKVCLLLDAADEMHLPDSAGSGMENWSRFVSRFVSPFPGNQVVLTCRYDDYTVPLTIDGRAVPIARIDPLGPENVRKMADIVRPDLAPEIFRSIERDPRLSSLLRTPLHLTMLLRVASAEDPSVTGRTGLFARFVWRLLHEAYAKKPELFTEPWFSRNDLRRIAQGIGSRSLDLRDSGRFAELLADIAFHLRSLPARPEPAKAFREAERTVNPSFGGAPSTSALDAATAAGILVPKDEEGGYDFYHPLLQDFFAAHRMVRGFDAERWRVKWQRDEVEPSSAEGCLLPLSGSGWEDATLMAACLAPDGSEFVRRVYDHNLVLAARCAVTPEARVDPELRWETQRALVVRMRNPEADLRARLEAGMVVVDIEAAGFSRQVSERCEYYLPPIASVPGGEATIGEDPREEEPVRFHANLLSLPKGTVCLPPFRLGVYPVTNAEYRRFMEDAGYESPEWWTAEGGEEWRSGSGSVEGLKWQVRVNRSIDRRWTAEYLRDQIGIRWSGRDALERIERMGWSDERFERWLDDQFPAGLLPREPLQWGHAGFDAPLQPVVGVSWFEAQAYCSWLSARSGMSFRLLAEREYEVAAAGQDGRPYAYGDVFDTTRSNVFATRIWQPSPVGLFDNATAQGVYDLTGNVWTWTSDWDLPEADFQVRRRVTRGGSYDTPKRLARAQCRDSNHPGYRDRYQGFRLAVSA